MNAADLRATLARLNLTTGQAARLCGVGSRFMRRCVAGQAVLPDEAAARLEAVGCNLVTRDDPPE